jgi:glutathione synthase/RimK-type ligase-like ATP-grasp enzyme
MLTSQRIFVEAITNYCRDHGIALELGSNGWLIVMQRGPRRHLAFGYDIGLNSAVAHQVANDKAATAELLEMSGVPCIPHALFLGPKLAAYVPASDSRAAMLGLLADHPAGIVVKPNEGTSGESVFWVTTRPALERAVAEIFAAYPSLAISPYVTIEDEVRVVSVDGAALVVYSKRRGLDWRHNLDLGAQPVLVEAGATREACVEIAARAAQAIGLRFGSIDVVRVGGAWKVLEVNSGVKMEALGRLHPELVHAAYHAALDKLFA